MGCFNHNRSYNDLKELVALLREFHFEDNNIIEVYRLDNIIGHRRDIKEVSIDDFVINASLSGMKPNTTCRKLSISIKLDYLQEQSICATSDIFCRYDLQLHIKGYKEENAAKTDEYSFFSWHLDRETNTNGDYAHPLYHFHAGGKSIPEQRLETGELLLISSPRIPHPPMDIILLIHFVLRNFINTKDQSELMKILDDDRYTIIIERAHQRVLDPYFHTFKDNNHTNYTPQNLFTLYL